jgi:hypothetical protein
MSDFDHISLEKMPQVIRRAAPLYEKEQAGAQHRQSVLAAAQEMDILREYLERAAAQPDRPAPAPATAPARATVDPPSQIRDPAQQAEPARREAVRLAREAARLREKANDAGTSACGRGALYSVSPLPRSPPVALGRP